MNRKAKAIILRICYACIFVLFIMGCKPTVPSEFISEGDMENILYDYHLASSMARQEKGDYESNVIANRAAVLKKYGITQAEFDTSMVYYMRHTERLHAIYKNIAERMEDQARALGSSEGSLASLSRINASGDTADIWKGDKSIALIPQQPYHLYSFAYVPDSSFHKGDSFILTMQSDFIYQDGVRDGVASLALVFKNDSVTSKVIHISSSTTLNLTLEDKDTLGIKELKGFFLLNKNNTNTASTTTLHLMALSNIHLLRCHLPKEKSKQPKKGNKASGDSLKKNSQNLRMERKLEINDSSLQKHRVK
ncbi:MAG: DUF4296 domain-containing protein [Prevotella sp.]|jgi:hypothetical protein